jgi:hypothetical protein
MWPASDNPRGFIRPASFSAFDLAGELSARLFSGKSETGWFGLSQAGTQGNG